MKSIYLVFATLVMSSLSLATNAKQLMCDVVKNPFERVYEQVLFNTDSNKLVLIDSHWGVEEHILEKHDYYPKSKIWIKKTTSKSTGSIILQKFLYMEFDESAIYSVVALTPDQKTTAWIQVGSYKCKVKK